MSSLGVTEAHASNVNATIVKYGLNADNTLCFSHPFNLLISVAFNEVFPAFMHFSFSLLLFSIHPFNAFASIC